MRTREDILWDINYYTNWAEINTERAEYYTKRAEDYTKKKNEAKQELKEFDEKEQGE